MRIQFGGPVGLLVLVLILLLALVREIDRARRAEIGALTPDTIDLALLQPYDLPSGWLKRSTTVEDTKANIFFYKNGEYRTPGVGIYQIIELYDTRDEVEAAADAASNYFLTENDPHYNLSGIHANEIRVNCRPFRVNDVPLKDCTLVAIYGTTLMIVSGGVFQGKHLSHDEFVQVILAADARMISISQ